MNSINVYVWQDVPNWGDELGFYLINRFCWGQNYNIKRVDKIIDANIVGIGSTLNHIPFDWEGIIAGPGFLKSQNAFFSKAQVLGVRGYLSDFKIHPYASEFIGDPGLVTPWVILVDPSEPADIGILPHWSDTALKYDSRFLGPWKTKFINPFRSPHAVINDIISCDKLVTSSLHGCVIADAYGIPRRIVPAWSMLNSPYEGGMFKFEDYMSAIDMEYQPEVLEKADQNTVERVQNDILRVYNSLPNYFNDINNNNCSDNGSIGAHETIS